MLSINTNLSSLIAQNSLTQSTSKLNQAIERMSTGFKINHASDNAANYSISTNMTTKMSAYQVAEDNVSMGLDMLTTASENLSQIESKLSRLRALATQASNGTYGGKSKDAINSEANALVDEIERLYNSTEYNGIRMFKNTDSSSNETSVDNTPTVYSLDRSASMMFAMTRTTGTSGNGFIEDPKTYEDSVVDAMDSIDSFTNGASGEFKIEDEHDLAKLATIVNDNGWDTSEATFVLANDIDLEEWCTTNGNWIPIGMSPSVACFQGVFNGNGHTIKNLKIDEEGRSYAGLFGNTEYHSQIKNVGLENAMINGGAYTGGLVGYSNGTITNCYVTGTIFSSDNYTGGLVGSSFDLINNCYTACNVEGKAYVGGIAGVAPVINNCYSTGDVTGTDCTGGLVGYINGKISNSYTTGTVTGSNTTGGLVGGGNAGYTITNSFSTGDVTGSTDTGGLVGIASGDSEITNSFSTGSVTGITNTGGLVGIANRFSVHITNCYSVQSDSQATQKTEDEILSTTNLESMGFTEENGWTIVDRVPVISNKYSTNSGSNSGGGGTPTPDPTPNPEGGSTGGGSSAPNYSPDSIMLQVGIGSGWSSQIGFSTKFELTGIEEFRNIGVDTTIDYLSLIDEKLLEISDKQTELGAVTNRLESVLDEIAIQYDNLVSSRSTLRDADMAELSSTYIKQQILQQASATLLATANQSPSIALQLI